MAHYSKLKKIQKIELSILKEIIKICNKYKIEYFVVEGTALGATRHGGFIPWDDDIDIGMTRNNYQKFLLYAKKELNEDLFLQTIFTDPEYPLYFAKVRKNNTKFIGYSMRKLNIHHGVYVDVFPFDITPEDTISRNIHRIKIRIYYYLNIMKSNMDFNNGLKKMSDIYKCIIIKLIRLIIKPIPMTLLYNLLDKERRRYNNKPIKSNLYIAPLNRPYNNKNHLFPVKKNKFEDIYVNVPNNCDAYLSYHYGDYMTPPPRHKRQGHEPFIVEVP